MHILVAILQVKLNLKVLKKKGCSLWTSARSVAGDFAA